MYKGNLRQRAFIVLLVLGLFLIAACNESGGDGSSTLTNTTGTTTAAPDNGNAGDNDDTWVAEDVPDDVDDAADENSGDHDEADDCVWDAASVFAVTLNGATITVDDGAGAVVNGAVATLTTAATYVISGTLNNGQVIVDTDDEETVKIILNGADITCTTNSPLAILNAEKTVVILADGTTNTVTDGAIYPDDADASGALFSDDDLTICGNGQLTVNGNYNDGIACKDGLVINSGTIIVNAVADDGIRGKDYLVVNGGNITVNSVGDAVKSDNDDDADKGYIYIKDGTFNITSQEDGFAAETDLLVEGGTFNITSGGGNNAVTADSAKGLKAKVSVVIEGGDFTIDSADDAVHSNDNIAINGGNFVISTGDDGVHADTSIRISNGSFNILKCYEGIEAVNIVIDDGEFYINSSDDGLNAAGGADSSGMGGGFVGGGEYYLVINGGYIAIEAVGDGIDANGTIQMTGGTVLVHGPTANNNSAIDYDVSFKITGGLLLAAGSYGMDQAPGNTSTQKSIRVVFPTVRAANTLFHVRTSGGTEITTFVPSKNYQSVVFSSPELVQGTTYAIYYGGTSTGTVSDGLYEGGTYTPGTQYTTFTLSSAATTVVN